VTTIDLFQHAPDSVIFAAGQIICREGEPGDVMYVVLEGEVEIVVQGRVIDTTGPVSQRRFTFLVQQTPFFALQVMRVMSERLRRLLAQDHQSSAMPSEVERPHPF
jgi:CRP/FNR family cyclic AMP-dependent transcriptional regulator